MNWFESRNSREKGIIIALVLVLLVVFLDMLLVTPYREYRQQQSLQLEQAREDLEWIRQAASRIQTTVGPGSPGIKGNIATYIDAQFSRAGLKKQLQQMTPLERRSVRVRLADVPFRQLMQFFADINPSVVVEEIRILPNGESGLVDVSMVLTNGAA
jgi:type II secretory pathway component PulM